MRGQVQHHLRCAACVAHARRAAACLAGRRQRCIARSAPAASSASSCTTSGSSVPASSSCAARRGGRASQQPRSGMTATRIGARSLGREDTTGVSPPGPPGGGIDAGSRHRFNTWQLYCSTSRSHTAPSCVRQITALWFGGLRGVRRCRVCVICNMHAIYSNGFRRTAVCRPASQQRLCARTPLLILLSQRCCCCGQPQ